MEKRLMSVERMLGEIEAGALAAKADASAIKKALKVACHKPESVEKYGYCIFHLDPSRYALNYGAATVLCAAHGARLCKMRELKDAQKNGYEKCEYGWVHDITELKDPDVIGTFNVRGTIAYPMQSAKPLCGNKVGIIEQSNIHVLNGNAGAYCCM